MSNSRLKNVNLDPVALWLTGRCRLRVAPQIWNDSRSLVAENTSRGRTTAKTAPRATLAELQASNQRPNDNSHWLDTVTGYLQSLVRHSHWLSTVTGETQSLVIHSHWLSTVTGNTQSLVIYKIQDSRFKMFYLSHTHTGCAVK